MLLFDYEIAGIPEYLGRTTFEAGTKRYGPLWSRSTWVWTSNITYDNADTGARNPTYFVGCKIGAA